MELLFDVSNGNITTAYRRMTRQFLKADGDNLFGSKWKREKKAHKYDIHNSIS